VPRNGRPRWLVACSYALEAGTNPERSEPRVRVRRSIRCLQIGAQSSGGFVITLVIRRMLFDHHLDASALLLKGRNQVCGLVLLFVGYAQRK
jgi:hypothetical protein